MKDFLKIIKNSLVKQASFYGLFLLILLMSGMGGEPKNTSAIAQISTINFSGTVKTDVAEDGPLALTSQLLTKVDRIFSQQFADHLNVIPKNNLPLLELPDFLANIDRITGTKSAIVYVYLQPVGRNIIQEATEAGPLDSLTGGVLPPNRDPQPTDELVLIVATAQGLFTPVPVSNVNRRDLLALQQQFQNNLTRITPKEIYLPQSTQFYEWLVTPMQEILQKQRITHLSFILDTGLRSLPIAALYNPRREKYLVEEFSLGLMPSLSLTNVTRPKSKETKLLAMGADTFPDQNPLPAVPLELDLIGNILSKGTIYLNQNFTVNNFKKAVTSREYGIVHLATHGEFLPGDRNNSFVVFSDQNLKMDQFANTGLDQTVDLMTLSACRTALGDAQAELGFTGLAVKTGVRTAIGSLWYVSDEGTFALMTNFYKALQQSPTKAESLRRAQRDLIEKRFESNGTEIIFNDLKIPLTAFPENIRKSLITKDLSHPYYWSAFTLVGNPW
ncbi:MAG: CHAT domain-containing protein [Snowella sp.]|nr:CHAT domain-containing protein [Snowella sp.]